VGGMEGGRAGKYIYKYSLYSTYSKHKEIKEK
jgi:hypothetical protein